MSLVFDRRHELADAPSAHALVVGVSAYRYLRGGIEPVQDQLGLVQLNSAARTAVRFCHWLIEHELSVPLGSCRLLISPQEMELAGEPPFDRQPSPCTLEALLHAAADWREDAAGIPENLAVLYLVGHGVEHSRGEQFFLLSDFADPRSPLLHHAVSLASIIDGMAPTRRRPDIARTQVYVCDSSRWRPSEALIDELSWTSATRVLDAGLTTVDDRASVLLYATAPGGKAYARPEGTTLFYDSLIRCLEGAAAEPHDSGRWVITVTSLLRALEHEVSAIRTEYGVDQAFVASGSIRDAPLAYLDHPPSVELRIALEPLEANAMATITLTNDDGAVFVPPPVPGGGFAASVPAGVYQVDVSVPTPFDSPRSRLRAVVPPRAEWKISIAK